MRHSSAQTIEARITANFETLTAQMRKAATYVSRNQVALASRSLRASASAAGVSPATFSRFARVLGYSDYEALREAARVELSQKIGTFSERAEKLSQIAQSKSAGAFLDLQISACQDNLSLLRQSIDIVQLERAATALLGAKKVLLVGALGSAGIIEHFCYQAQWISENWEVAGKGGRSVAASMARMEHGDVVLVLTKSPYAKSSLRALDTAISRGLTTLVFTDSAGAPGMAKADLRFVLPTESANFFSSYTGALVVFEALIAMLVVRLGAKATKQIAATESITQLLGDNAYEDV